MKKLLAFLLALMLPCCALADCVCMNLRWTIAPEGINELIHAFTGGQRYPLVEEWLEELAPFANSFDISSAVDSEAGYGCASLRYQSEDFITYDVTATDAGMVMRSSWMKDALLFAQDNLYEIKDPLPRTWNAVDWDATLRAFRAIFIRWSEAMESTEETGRFAGETYEGGTLRTTVRFDDRDLALLMDMLLDGPWPESFTALMRQPVLAVREEPEQALAFLRNEIRKAALNNRYRYVLHLVENDNATPIGLSVIVYLEDQQVSTLSIGRPAGSETMTCVLGWGLRDRNYYLTAQIFEPDENGRFLTAALLQDPTRLQSVSAITADPANTLMQAEGYNLDDGHTAAQKFSLTGDVMMDMKVDLTFSHAENEEGSASTMLVDINDQRLVQIDLDYDEAPSLTAPDLSELKPVDVQSLSSDEVIALFKTINSGIDEFGVQLFKLIPPKLLTLPMNRKFFSPE